MFTCYKILWFNFGLSFLFWDPYHMRTVFKQFKDCLVCNGKNGSRMVIPIHYVAFPHSSIHLITISGGISSASIVPTAVITPQRVNAPIGPQVTVFTSSLLLWSCYCESSLSWKYKLVGQNLSFSMTEPILFISILLLFFFIMSWKIECLVLV